MKVYILLNDSIDEGEIDTKIEGIETIITIYKDWTMDFKESIDIIYTLLYPVNLNLKIKEIEKYFL